MGNPYLYSIPKSLKVFQAVNSNLEIINNSQMHDQGAIIGSYASNVSVSDMNIYETTIDTPAFTIVTSNLTLSNCQIYSMSSSNESPLINVNEGSGLNMNNIKFYDSNLNLLEKVYPE